MCGGIREFHCFFGGVHIKMLNWPTVAEKQPYPPLACRSTAVLAAGERMSAMEEIRSRKLQPIYNALERYVRAREKKKVYVAVDPRTTTATTRKIVRS